MRSTLLLSAFMLLYGLQSHAKSPIFKACKTQIEDPVKAEECSKQALEKFTAKATRFISKEVGFYSNETVTATIKVDEDGDVKVKRIDSKYTTILEDQVEKWLELLEGKVIPNGETEKFEIDFQFEVPSKNEVDIYDTDNLPTQSACQDFNGAGKRSCLEDVIVGVLGNLDQRRMQAYSVVEAVLTHSGQFIGVRFKTPVTKAMRKVNDSIALRLNQLRNVRFVNNSSYSSTNIKFRYTYDHFYDSPVRRQFIKDIAPRFLAESDTGIFIKELYSSACDFHRYKHFNEYITEVLTNNDISVEDYFKISEQNGFIEMDSLSQHDYYFDERTSDRLAKDFVYPLYKGCGIADTAEYECTLDKFTQSIFDYVEYEHGVNLFDDLYSNPGGSAREYSIAHQLAQVDLGSENGFYIFMVKIDVEGKIVSARPILYSHLPMIDKLKEAEERGATNEELLEIVNSQVTYKLIDAITRIDQLLPATINSRKCQSKIRLHLYTGKRK